MKDREDQVAPKHRESLNVLVRGHGVGEVKDRVGKRSCLLIDRALL